MVPQKLEDPIGSIIIKNNKNILLYSLTCICVKLILIQGIYSSECLNIIMK